MIDPKVQKIADNFVKQWNQYLSVNQLLLLDYSWPSVSILDLITFTCRYKKELPDQLNDTLKGVAAYLSIIAENCFQDVVKEVKVFEKEQNVTIELIGGKTIPAEENVTIPVEKMLKSTLMDLPNPFPVTRKFKTDITFDSQIISLFAIGVFTGLAPGIEGWWNSKSEDFLDPIIKNTTKILALKSSEHYAKLFSQEPLGQLAEFYLNKLIYPPMMMNENLPLLSSIDEVILYFKDYNISVESALRLGENLALNPDPLFSNLGLVLVCALSKKIPNSNILAAAQRKGSYVAFLRRAVRKVREYYGFKSDWIEFGLKTPELKTQFIIERSMKFLPWLVLSTERIVNDIDDYILTPLIIKICDYDIDGAIEMADKILDVRPEDVEVIMQRLKLETMRGDQADFDKISFLEKNLMSSAKADSLPEYYLLMGSLALAKKEPVRALNLFKAGTTLKMSDPLIMSDLLNNAAWSCILLSKLGQALIFLEQAYLSSNCPVTILLNKTSVLWDMGDYKGAIAVRKKLFALSPFDRRVFASLTLEEMLKN